MESVNIVIADDLVLVQNRLGKMLSDIPGIRILGCAANSSETIRQVKDKKPDAVILNIKMPGESSQYKAICYKSGTDYFFDKSMEFRLIADVLHEMAMEHFYYTYN